jgi:DNA-binding transcriptional ArsR family regulator
VISDKSYTIQTRNQKIQYMLTAREIVNIRSTFDTSKESFLTNSFRALGDANRNRIFHLLCLKGEMSAGNIADALKISRSLASQHLKILTYAHLCKKRKSGFNIMYQLNRENTFVRKLISTVKTFG